MSDRDPPELAVRLRPGIAGIEAAEWNGLNHSGDPFTSHEFLAALEQSHSVGPGTGWEPAPICITDAARHLVAAMPSYAKSHSQGEYVFDHAWADAYQRAGGQYYPKLQIAVPFTPAAGSRLLLTDPALAPHLLKGAEAVCLQNGFSSAHATFVAPEQVALFEAAGWLVRTDIQFHWINRGYSRFEDFLAALSSRKRKDLRKERAAAQAAVRIERLTGRDIRPEHWDAFWIFYQDTGARKWGSPYLTRDAFTLLGETMGERIVLILAYDGEEPIAGALNFIGTDALFGRYWGCTREVRFLHFELCYYQAIDLAIELGLSRVEAGAQGGHKLARGYEPVETYSAHWIADPGFRAAVAEFLERERQGVAADRLFLDRHTPFRKD